MKILLINPPVTKPSEPPQGLAKLAGALRTHSIKVTIWDANLSGLDFLLDQPPRQQDKWTMQAWAQAAQWRQILRSPQGYESLDRYTTAIRHLNRILAVNSRAAEASVGLADYQHDHWNPARSADLFDAATHPEANPFAPYLASRLDEIGEKEKPDCVGLSINYLSQALTAFALIGLIRQRWPGTRIVAGGGLVSCWLQKNRGANPFPGLIDKAISGEGEGPLLQFLGMDARAPEDSLPDYTSFPISHYWAPGPILPYHSARGCYWNRCAFCPEVLGDARYRPLSIARVRSDLSQLTAALRPALIHFTDNAMGLPLLRSLSEDPPGTPWYGFARITPQLKDAGFCRDLARSGCRMLKLGLESGEDAVLQGMHKGFTATAASAVLYSLAEAGIATYVYLLFGTPWEDEAAAMCTARFIHDHARTITFLNPAIFNLPAESQTTAGLMQRPFYHGDLSLYLDFQHPQGWERKKVRFFLDRHFKRQPAIAAILRRTPPSFTSNHAAFFASGFSEYPPG
jgi:hypothetical protein